MAEITPEDVERFAKLGDLALPRERLELVASILNAWVPAANELSRKMSEPRFRHFTPMVRFSTTAAEPEAEL